MTRIACFLALVTLLLGGFSYRARSQGAPGAADWAVESRENLPSAGPDAAKVRLKAQREGLPAVNAHVVLFDPAKYTLRVVDDAGKRLANLREAMEQTGALAGVNGGYFHPDHSPLGLVISGGEEVHPQETAKLLSGLIVATERELKLLRPKEYKPGKGVLDALQAGPYLVDEGKPVTGLNAEKSSRRTAVAVLEDGRWALISLSPVTLAEAGALLSGEGLWPGAKARRVLNLDGGSSTGFYLRAPKSARPLYLAEFGQVRNYLALFPRPERSGGL